MAGASEKVWGDYPVYFKQPYKVCTSSQPHNLEEWSYHLKTSKHLGFDDMIEYAIFFW